MADWLLYEHDDGRHAVAPSAEAATFAKGDPAWHRVGPVEVPDESRDDDLYDAAAQKVHTGAGMSLTKEEANAYFAAGLFNPINQVYFRAGLIACREYMARFVEAQSPEIAASIRANWWPTLGPDFGPPRQMHWDELAEGSPDEGNFKVKEPVSPTLEALPIALQFLQTPPLVCSRTAGVPDLVQATEWSSDYRCRKCGEVFNVADDSDHALDPQRGHKCASGVAIPQTPKENDRG